MCLFPTSLSPTLSSRPRVGVCHRGWNGKLGTIREEWVPVPTPQVGASSCQRQKHQNTAEAGGTCTRETHRPALKHYCSFLFILPYSIPPPLSIPSIDRPSPSPSDISLPPSQQKRQAALKEGWEYARLAHLTYHISKHTLDFSRRCRYLRKLVGDPRNPAVFHFKSKKEKVQNSC